RMAIMVATPENDTPWTSGSWDPNSGMPRVCSSVARPPMNRQAVMSSPSSSGGRPAASPMIRGTAMMPPYMVRTCWKPKARLAANPGFSSSGRVSAAGLGACIEMSPVGFMVDVPAGLQVPALGAKELIGACAAAGAGRRFRGGRAAHPGRLRRAIRRGRASARRPSRGRPGTDVHLIRSTWPMPRTRVKLSVEGVESMAKTNSPAERHDLQERQRPHALIDVRERGEYALDQILGSVPIARGLIESRVARVIPWHDVQVIVYCDDGYRSGKAAETLEQIGYRDVSVLDG